jgi:hypothetical protein
VTSLVRRAGESCLCLFESTRNCETLWKSLEAKRTEGARARGWKEWKATTIRGRNIFLIKFFHFVVVKVSFPPSSPARFAIQTLLWISLKSFEAFKSQHNKGSGLEPDKSLRRRSCSSSKLKKSFFCFASLRDSARNFCSAD